MWSGIVEMLEGSGRNGIAGNFKSIWVDGVEMKVFGSPWPPIVYIGERHTVFCVVMKRRGRDLSGLWRGVEGGGGGRIIHCEGHCCVISSSRKRD